jgi:hypothetical protein
MYSGFVPGTNPMARKAEQQRLMREAKQLTPAAALMRGLGEGYFGDVTTPNAEQGYSVMDPSNRAPAGREAEMQRYRDIGTALGIAADPASIIAPAAAKPIVSGLRAAENATVGSLQRARIARVAEEARRTPESVYNPLRERLENQGALQFAVKPEKGGNWISRGVDRHLQGLKTKNPEIDISKPPTDDESHFVYRNFPEVDLNFNRALEESDDMRFGDTYWKWFETNYPAEFQSLMSKDVPSVHLNNWIDKKLGKYIRNDMATPHDPVRKLADEKGVLHVPFNEEPVYVDTRRRRQEAGLPVEGFAKTPLGQQWEGLADQSIISKSAKNVIKQAELARPTQTAARDLEDNPWLRNLPPQTRVYDTRPGEMSLTGFDHLVDELAASLAQNSELPANLRLTVKELDKMTVPHAVEHVAKVNEWRALEAAKAEQAGMMENLNSNARLADPTAKLSFVEKPGLTWVDVPEVIDEKGTKLCTSIGKAGGWCTMNASTAREYGSGYNRLVALLDAEGRPHAQAMITESSTSPYILWYEQNPHRSPENNAFMDWVEQRARAGGSKKSSDQLYLEWAKETGRQIPHQESFDIQELKPPGNAFSSDRSKTYEKRDPDYQKKVSESVVKFLNSGQWGNVNDLYHYDIFDLSDPSSYESLTKLFGEEGADKVFAATRANGGTPPVRFMTRDQAKDFIERPEIVYHAGAEFNEPRPGLFTHPEREVVEKFQSSTNSPQLHTFEARPRSSGTEEDVYRVARQLGIYDPEIPVGQYLEQGENAIFPQSAQVVEELRNLGFDSLRLQDAMGKKPSLVALDPSVLRRVPPAEGYAEGGTVKSDFFLDPSSYVQSRSKQMFPKQKSEWTQQDAARHMLASGMMAQKFGPTVAKIAGLAHEHGNAPVKTIGYMLGIGKMPPDYDQDLHNNALGVQLAKDAASQEDLESRIQAILNSATKQPTPGKPWIGRPNIPAQMSDYAKGGKVSTNPFDHLV